MFVKVNGELHFPRRAANHEGDVLERFLTKMRDKKPALKLLGKAMRKHGCSEVIVTDRHRSYGAALTDIGSTDRGEAWGLQK